MAIKTYSDKPYHDDFATSTDKGYLRILFRPGRSVQVRELNQIQSNVQDQIDKFGRHVFKDGDRVLDGYSQYDEGIKSVAIQFINNSISVDELNALKGKEIVKDGNENLRAKVVGVETTTIGSDQYRLYLKYGGEGSSGEREFADTDEIDLASGEDTITIGSAEVAAGEKIGDISTSEEDPANYGGFFQDEGVFFIKGHFVHVDTTESFIIKDSNGKISGDLFFDIDESIVTSADDSSLLDNANGQPNINAPGGDRYKIALTLKFVKDGSGNEAEEGQQRIHLLEINQDKVVSPVRTEYSELGKALAQRTEEESGSYTLKPFKHDIREYLNDEAGNRGKFTAAEIVAAEDDIDSSSDAEAFGEKQYIVGIEPSIAYVNGYRVELEDKQDVTLDKGRTDTDTYSNYKLSATRGQYIEGCFIDGDGTLDQGEIDNFKFEPNKDYAFYQDESNPGVLIGKCRIQAIENTGLKSFNQDSPASAVATKRLYIYDINLEDGKKISDAKILAIDHSDDTSSLSDSYLYNDDGFAIIGTGDDQSRMVYPLSGYTVKEVNPSGSTIIIQQRFAAAAPTLNGPSADITINSALGSHVSTNPDDYVVVQEGTSVEDADGEAYVKSVTIGGGGDSAVLSIFLASGAAPSGPAITGDITVFAPVEVALSIKTKRQQTGTTIKTNTTLNPGDVITLDDVDVYNLTGVSHTGNPDSPSTTDIQNDFELVTGQTDTHYDYSRVIYKGTGAFKSGTLTINYNYYDHSGTGNVFAANSYQDVFGGQIDIEDIPKYEGLRLSNCLDFRPSVDDGTADNGIKPNSLISVNFDHYLPRRDIIVLTQLGEVKVITGIADKNPQYPDVPADSLLLYQIDKPGYVYSIGDIDVIASDSRRYTMRDIGDLDDRIKNLEYYTALTALENEAAGIQIQDASGNRFKNGIITDSFTGHGMGDTRNRDYRVAIDRENFSARPTYLSENTRWQYISGMAADETTTVSNWNGDPIASTTQYSGKRGNTIVLDHIEKTLIDQPFASDHISVNPYDVATWSGSLELSPSSDEWKDVTHVPDIVHNVEGDNNAILEQIANDPNVLGTEWGEWSANWNGRLLSRSVTWRNTGRIRRLTRTITTRQTERREGIQTSLVEGTVREVIDSKVLNTTFIPFIRSRKIFFKAQLLKPNTTFYMFMDDVNITNYCGEDTFQQFGGNNDVERFEDNFPASISGSVGSDDGTPLTTDSKGFIEGFIVIPNNDTLRFRTGSRQIRITDSSTNNRTLELSSAETTYHAKGLLETRQRTILSTRQLVIERTRVTEDRVNISTRVVRRDPVAQTFMIGNEPTGIFLSSIDIFFQAKDPTLPVELSVVSVENGIPTQNTIPFSRVIKNPNDVSVDATRAQSATTFRFDTPIYLEPGIEYAIVLISNSARYRVWYAEPGGFNKVLDGQVSELITKNINLGVLLKSQNASTWTPDQNKDLKFKLKRADFKTDASQTALFSGLCPQRGEVSYIDLDSPGTGYLTGAPTITVGDPPAGGSTATAKAYVGNGGVIDTIEVLTNGSGYDSPGGTMPTITIGARDRINIPTGSVTAADDTIELPSNSIKVKNGQSFEYNEGTGSAISGLTSGDTYYAEAVEKDDDDNIRPVEYSRLIRLYLEADLDSPAGVISLGSQGNDDQYLLPNNPIPTATAKTDTWKASTYLPIIQDMNLPETSSTYQMHVGSGPSNQYTVFPGELLYTGTRVEHDKRSGSSGSGDDELKLEATLSTTDSKVSPVVDLDRISLVTFDNIVTNSSEFETIRDGGESAARYITRKVTLKSPADQVNVYVDIMRPDDSTDIEIYAKYKYLNDNTPFDALGWTKIDRVGDNKLPVNTDFEFKEVEFEGKTTTEFSELSIKVLFKSSDKAYVPEIKNLRVIATA